VKVINLKDEEFLCPYCESESEFIDVVDEHHVEVYRCKVFNHHIFYVTRER